MSPSTSTPNKYFANFDCRTNALSYLKEVCEIEVLRLLFCWTTSKATGLDQISAYFLKSVAPRIALMQGWGRLACPTLDLYTLFYGKVNAQSDL